MTPSDVRRVAPSLTEFEATALLSIAHLFGLDPKIVEDEP